MSGSGVEATYPIRKAAQVSLLIRVLRKARKGQWVLYLVGMVYVLIIVIPLIWSISFSFKPAKEVYQARPSLFPRALTLANYAYIFSYMQERIFWTFLRNSLIVSGGTVTAHVVLSSLAGYAYARMRFRGRDALFYTMIVLMFVPQTGGLMARYEVMHFLKMRNNLLGLILLFSSNLAVHTFIMRQAFLQVPRELEESALIDGAGRWKIFWLVALPLVTGAMLVVAIFTFINVWGEYLVTLTMIDVDRLLTLSVAITRLSVSDILLIPGAFATVQAVTTAGALITALPVVIVYLLFQRWFVRGLMSGILKL